jgi:hypothetical protein
MVRKKWWRIQIVEDRRQRERSRYGTLDSFQRHPPHPVFRFFQLPPPPDYLWLFLIF